MIATGIGRNACEAGYKVAKLNDSQYYLALELCKFLEKKNQDSLYLWTYKDSVSSLTTSSKSVMSLRPLTCHIPVIPGLIAIRAL